MGFTPAQVDAMPVWQFTAAAQGYAEAHGGRRTYMPSDARLRELGIEGFDG